MINWAMNMYIRNLKSINIPVLLGASIMLSMSMGMRQSLGVFMPELTKDIGISVSEFTMAIAIQNLSWGFLQPLVGAWAGQFGFKKLMLFGSLIYTFGLIMLATAHHLVWVTMGAGLMIGLSLACTGSAMALAVSTRGAPLEIRSTILGLVSSIGSLGAMIAAPIGQSLSQEYGWRFGVYGFIALSLIMLPCAWIAGKVDDFKINTSVGFDAMKPTVVVKSALMHPPFLIMTVAYFVCGMQLVFLTTHLPTYLSICGMDPMLSAKALGMIGGFNALGSLFFGWAGGKYNKMLLLGGIYILRSLGLAAFFYISPTPTNTLVFAAFMGFLWLGVAPLVTGAIIETFGLKWQAMLSGLAFMSHQLGSFIGALGGGLIFDHWGSYNLAIEIGVTVGLLAGVSQCISALTWPQTPAKFASA
jgi:predicted MFS family arabinose efflux permease